MCSSDLDLVEDRHNLQSRINGLIDIGQGLGLHPLAGVHHQKRALTGGQAPAQISLYRGPILRQCDTEAEMCREIADTLVHELGHHVGLDDDEMPY